MRLARCCRIRALPDEYFGEGITVLGKSIIQLTWRSQKRVVYDKNGFAAACEFTYGTEGWGITHDRKRLVMSDGTSTLYFLDAGSFETIDSIQVHDHERPIDKLNELEFIDGQLWANIWRGSFCCDLSTFTEVRFRRIRS